MALGKNIQARRKHLKISQEALSELTGGKVSQGAISALEKRDSSSSEHAPLIAKALGISLDELTTGEVSEFKSAHRDKPDKLTIHQFDVSGSMGGGLLLRDQTGVIEDWRVSHDWLRNNLRGHSSTKDLCVVTGFGDSMRPMYNSGDPLIIDSSVKTVEVDGIYFFRVGSEGFIKRLQRIPGNGLMAISDNSRYIPWTISDSMDFEVFGRVIKVWKSEDL